MKNRVQLNLEDTPYKLLRVIAAEDNKSMSEVVEDFLMGETRTVAGEAEAMKELDRLGYEEDEVAKAEDIDVDTLPDPHNEVVKEICQIDDYDTTPTPANKRCKNVAVVRWTAPSGWQLAGQSFWLCEKHLKEVASV